MSLCTTVIHNTTGVHDYALYKSTFYLLTYLLTYNTAQNSCDNFPSYPLDNHHGSDDVYWKGGWQYWSKSGDVCAPCEEADEQVDEFLSGSDAHLYSQAVEHGKEQAEQMINHLWTFTTTCTTRHNSTSLSSSLIHTWVTAEYGINVCDSLTILC